MSGIIYAKADTYITISTIDMTQGEKSGTSVAIIGAGAAGLTGLFELLHTKKGGSTSLKYNSDGSLDEQTSINDDPAFGDIVVFEQSEKVGGVWNPSFDETDVIPQELFDTERYDDPTVLRPKTKIPDGFSNQPYAEPLKIPISESIEAPIKWNRSGIYKSLFSNVARRYLRNSFIPLNPNEEGKSSSKKNRPIDPFITNFEVTDQLLTFVEKYSLLQYVRTNSEVVDVKKSTDGLDQWIVTVRKTDTKMGIDKWYSQRFDKVVVSNGHYSIPHIPRIEGLSKWNKRAPGSISHSKAFRDESIFKNKRVVFIGTGLSGIDILQYAFPLAKEVIVARTPGKKEIFEWLGRAACSEGIVVKPRISSVDYENGKTVKFVDGTEIQDVDLLVFSTGYHWRYPFLNEDDTGISIINEDGSKKIATHTSLVDGLFKSTFSNKDPSLAFIGVLMTQFKWPSFEFEAAIIAAVWSGYAKLPPLEKRLEEHKKRLAETGTNLGYHFFPDHEFVRYVDDAKYLLPANRRSEDIFDPTYIDEQLESVKVAEKLFHELKENTISVHETE